MQVEVADRDSEYDHAREANHDGGRTIAIAMPTALEKRSSQARRREPGTRSMGVDDPRRRCVQVRARWMRGDNSFTGPPFEMRAEKL